MKLHERNYISRRGFRKLGANKRFTDCSSQLILMCVGLPNSQKRQFCQDD
jgi:hypothetical protein